MPILLLALTIQPVWLLWWPRISVRGTRYFYIKAIVWKMRLEMSFAFGGSLQEPRPWSPKATQFHKMPQGSYWILSTRKATDKCVIDAEICLTCLWSSKSLEGEDSCMDNSKQASCLKNRGSRKEGFFLFPEKGSLPRSRGLKDKDYASTLKLSDTKQKRPPHMKRARSSMHQVMAWAVEHLNSHSQADIMRLKPFSITFPAPWHLVAILASPCVT